MKNLVIHRYIVLVLLAICPLSIMAAMQRAQPLLRGLRNPDSRCQLNTFFQLLAPVVSKWNRENAFRGVNLEGDNALASYLRDFNAYDKGSRWGSYTLRHLHMWARRNNCMRDNGVTRIEDLLRVFCPSWNGHVPDASQHSIVHYYTSLKKSDLEHSKNNYCLPLSLAEELSYAEKNDSDWTVDGPPSWKHVPGAFFIFPDALQIATALPYFIPRNKSNKLPLYHIHQQVDMSHFLKHHDKNCYELAGAMHYTTNRQTPQQNISNRSSQQEQTQAFAEAWSAFNAAGKDDLFHHAQAMVRDDRNGWHVCDDRTIYRINEKASGGSTPPIHLYPAFHPMLLYQKQSRTSRVASQNNCAKSSYPSSEQLVINPLPFGYEKSKLGIVTALNTVTTAMPAYFTYLLHTAGTSPDLMMKYGAGSLLWALAYGRYYFDYPVRQRLKKVFLGQRYH